LFVLDIIAGLFSDVQLQQVTRVAVTDERLGIWKAAAYATTALELSNCCKRFAANVLCCSTTFRDGDTGNKVNTETKTTTARKWKRN
jgi:hypothetical protein